MYASWLFAAEQTSECPELFFLRSQKNKYFVLYFQKTGKMFYGPSSLFYGSSFFIFEEPKYALQLISGPVIEEAGKLKILTPGRAKF